MSIAGKHWYRFEFLKSDEWRDFRLQLLTDCGGRCYICTKRDQSNDIHHVWYGEPSFTGVRQFLVLCRTCHDKVHAVLVPFKASNETERRDAWQRFCSIASIISKNTPKDTRPKCRSCFSRGNTILIDPVRQIVHEEQGKGIINLCPACFGDLKQAFPPYPHGTAKL